MNTVVDRYWDTMNEFKAHCYYVHGYLLHSESWSKRIDILLAITSSTSIGGWAIWHEYSFVWASLIATSQVVNAVKLYLPFSKRIKPLRSLSYSYDDLFIDLEEDWYHIAQGELTEGEIHSKIIDFKRKNSSLWKKHIGEVLIPHNQSLHDEAVQIARQYFTEKY